MSPNPQEIADFVTFTEEILKGKLHFLCSNSYWESSNAVFLNLEGKLFSLNLDFIEVTYNKYRYFAAECNIFAGVYIYGISFVNICCDGISLLPYTLENSLRKRLKKI